MIKFFKNIWIRDIKVKDRLYFSLVLLALSCLLFYTQHAKYNIPLAQFQTEFYVIAGFLFSFVLIGFWGNFILRIWLTIAGLMGQIVFISLLVFVYYLILSPVFILVNLFKKKKPGKTSNWIANIYVNKDYESLG